MGGLYQTQLLGKSTSFENIYGIQASYFVADRWSVEYSISYASVSFSPSYGKFYGGSVLAWYGTSLSANSFTTDGYWTLALFSLLVPEGVSYHIPVGSAVTISPYLNLLTVDYYAPTSVNSYWRMSNSAGVKLNMVLGDVLNISPHAYTIVQYRGKSAGGSVGGVGVGLAAKWVF